MDFRLIALDLDGTLLSTQKQLSARNRKAIIECIRRGIYIVPSTGRTVIGLPEELMSISGIRYAVTLNGAVVMDMKQHKVIASALFPKKEILELIDYVKQFPLMYDVYIEGRGKSESRFINNLECYGINPYIRELVIYTRDIVPTIREYVAECEHPVEKMNLFFGDLTLKEQVREGLKQFPYAIVSSSMKNNLEINVLDANKGNGLLQLASCLGINPKQIMAFGDGENDHTMIIMAGMGVAMKNSENSLLEKADYITDSNDEDGVAKAIEKFIL